MLNSDKVVIILGTLMALDKGRRVATPSPIADHGLNDETNTPLVLLVNERTAQRLAPGRHSDRITSKKFTIKLEDANCVIAAVDPA